MKRRFVTTIVLTALICTLGLVKQTSSALAESPVIRLPVAEPEQVGMSTERLSRISDHFQGYIDREEASGALAMIARRGKIAYMKTWGDRDREAGKPMTDDTIFRIYSMSKPITSVALMTLYEEGKFFLNDPIAKYLPEFANMQVDVEGSLKPADRPITIRDLMRHTAGFTYGIFGDTAVDRQYRDARILAADVSLKDTVNNLARIPLRFQPGTTYHYSVAVDVQGRLVEVLSGQPFDEFLKERIFRPLNMVDTDFSVVGAKRDRFAQLYTPQGTESSREMFLKGAAQTKLIEPQKATPEQSQFDEKTVFFSGGGGLVSTAADYWRFCQMMLNGGEFNGNRILSRKSVEMMTTDHLGSIDFPGPGTTFGLGFSVITDVGQNATLGSEGTYAWGGAAGTKFWIDPEEELIGIFMVQILPHRTRMGSEFSQLTYQAIND